MFMFDEERRTGQADALAAPIPAVHARRRRPRAARRPRHECAISLFPLVARFARSRAAFQWKNPSFGRRRVENAPTHWRPLSLSLPLSLWLVCYSACLVRVGVCAQSDSFPGDSVRVRIAGYSLFLSRGQLYEVGNDCFSA